MPIGRRAPTGAYISAGAARQKVREADAAQTDYIMHYYQADITIWAILADRFGRKPILGT